MKPEPARWTVVSGEAGRGADRVCEGSREDGVDEDGEGCAADAEGAETPAPDSRTEGSAGGGPSIAQRRDSYLERIKDSILLLVRASRVIDESFRNWKILRERDHTLVRRNVPWLQVSFPVEIGPLVAPFHDRLKFT